MAMISILVASVLSTNISPGQSDESLQPFGIRCEICGGAFFIVIVCEINKYNNYLEMDNHVYNYTYSPNNDQPCGYRHLRCSVTATYLYDQILQTLNEITKGNYENARIKSYAAKLIVKVENELEHLLNLLITLFKEEHSLQEQEDKHKIKECFHGIEKLSFELTLEYLFVSMGQLRNKLCEKLIYYSSMWPIEDKEHMQMCIINAVEKVQKYQITNENKPELSVLFNMHDTFFLPLLFSPNKLVDIYDNKKLIDNIQCGDCFLENPELRETAVFRHIFLACLINDIKANNQEIKCFLQRFRQFSRKYCQCKESFLPEDIEKLICELDILEKDITGQSKKLITFYFCEETVKTALQKLRNNLINVKNGQSTQVVNKKTLSTWYLGYKSNLSQRLNVETYKFNFLVPFIWRFINFSSTIRLFSHTYSKYFNKYADNMASASKFKYNHQTGICYILLNHIFCYAGIGLHINWEVLAQASKNNMKGEVYSIYMVTNYGTIVAALKYKSKTQFYSYISKTEISGTLLPMFSKQTPPIGSAFTFMEEPISTTPPNEPSYLSRN